MSAALTARAWFELLQIDLIKLRGFRAIKRTVSRTKTRPRSGHEASVPEIVDAVIRASLWYFKPPHCLQRSVAVTRLLRRRGVPAELVVGCHMAPMRAHAWVEVAGDVVCDQVDDLKHYKILDRW